MTRTIKVKNVLIGGGNRVTVQSMTNTKTADIAATSEQIERLIKAGCDIVRLAGTKNGYRYKIAHYRILFTWNKGEIVITVIEINTRTNIKY